MKNEHYLIKANRGLLVVTLLLPSFFLLMFVVLPWGINLVLDKEWDRQRIQCEHREAQGYDVNCEVYYAY